MLSQTNGMMSSSESQNHKNHIVVEKRLAAVAKENRGSIQQFFC